MSGYVSDVLGFNFLIFFWNPLFNSISITQTKAKKTITLKIKNLHTFGVNKMLLLKLNDFLYIITQYIYIRKVKYEA